MGPKDPFYADSQQTADEVHLGRHPKQPALGSNKSLPGNALGRTAVLGFAAGVTLSFTILLLGLGDSIIVFLAGVSGAAAAIGWKTLVSGRLDIAAGWNALRRNERQAGREF